MFLAWNVLIWSLSVQFGSFLSRSSAQNIWASQKIQRFPVSSRTAFKLQVDSPVGFPVSHHVVQSAFIQEQRSWFWTLFEVLVRVWPIETLEIPMFGTGSANLEPVFKVKRHPKCVFNQTRFFVKTELTHLPLPPFTQIQKYNKVSFSSLL